MILKFLLALAAVPFALAVVSQERLVRLAEAGKGVIQLNSSSFDLLTSQDRTWSATVHLTALDNKRRCSPCKDFQPSFIAVAQAWSQVPKEYRNSHFFATLDFDNGQDVFHKLSLQSAPVVLVYPAARGPRASARTSPHKYDFPYGFDAAPLAESMSKHTPIPIPFREPIHWERYIYVATFAFSFLAALRFIFPIFQTRWTWAICTILVSLVMTSGYMFTRIRGSPYNGPDGNWIAPGYQNQFGQEVIVIASMYGLLAFSVLMLATIVPYQRSPHRQRVQIYVWTGMFMIVYSVLISSFRVKNRGYPFKLFL